MAAGDAYTSAAFGVADTNTAVFDGADSSTGAAVLSGLAGNGNAEIRLQAYDGSSWTTVAQLQDASGDSTFTADWHTQFNRIIINGGGSPSAGNQRVEITNISGSNADFSADGDEK